MNPWLSMWSQPRVTIRVLVHNKPAYGVFYLAVIYALQSLLYYANWWSVGLNYSSFAILLTTIILSPFLGVIWLYFMTSLLYLTGRVLKGHAPFSHLRAAYAWSKLPSTVSLFMWLVLIFVYPDTVFLQDGGGPSSIFINLITFILGIWTFILLIGALREVQSFSVARSITNIVLSSLASSLIVFFLILCVRYLK